MLLFRNVAGSDQPWPWPMRLPRHPTAFAATLVLLLAAGTVHAQTAWREGFEAAGPPTWRQAGGDAPFRVLQHQRLQQDAHSGSGCEWLRLETASGSCVYMAHDVGRPAVIDDLAVSVWVRSDHPGTQLAVRIVLPRSTDPRTGRGLTAVVFGDRYSDAGRWQQLHIEKLSRLLEREVHLLRTQFGSGVDSREACVDAVLLNVYSGQGMSNVWVDDLELTGYVNVGQSQDAASGSTGPTSNPAAWSSGGVIRLPPVGSSQSASPKHTVKLAGSVLLVDGRPMFPRIIQYRGEPLELLKRMGFNVVWLPRLADTTLLEEADRLGIWLICPPPGLEQVAGASGRATRVAPPIDLGPQYDCVLTWDLGNDLGSAELESTQQWAEQIHAADRRMNRPLVCRARTDLRAYSRAADLLLIDRRPLGTSLNLTDYAAWVRRQPLLASLGTPVWTSVQTQPNEALRQQLAMLDASVPPPLGVTPEQVRLLCYTAVAAGSRGVLFTSDSPLTATDADTRQRAMTLELLNLELDLIEPWAAAGASAAAATCTVPEVSGAVLSTDRARLLLPMWSSPGSQCVLPQSAANGLTLVVPGVPEASSAYELTPHGVEPLRHRRVAGGVSIALDEFGLATQVLLAQDPLVIAAVHHRAAQWGRRAAELQRHLAVHKLNTVEATARQLTRLAAVPQAASWVAAARKDLQLCDAQLAAGNLQSAALNAQRADRSLRLVQRAYWDASQKGLVSIVTSPPALGFDTLPSHWRLLDRLRSARLSDNAIAGGDFENVETMQRAGWQFFYQPASSVQGSVDVAPQAAHSGRFGLRLMVSSVDPKKPPAAIESPPVLFASPPVQATAGQLVCIHGWVQVPSPIMASTDGLLIVDSVSGEALADRFSDAKGWREFAMYRVATRSGPVGITFALTGIGEAWLDDVAIQVVADR